MKHAAAQQPQPAVQFAIGVVTFDALSHMRHELLEQTLASLAEAFPRAPKVLLDNGTDGTRRMLSPELLDSWRVVVRDGPVAHRTPGAGHNAAVRALNAVTRSAGIYVLSDDDMLWPANAADVLGQFWASAPEDVAIACAYLEPDFAWSKPLGVLECGGVRALGRPSVPGAAWTFRPRVWKNSIGPVPEEPFDYDSVTCRALTEKGLRLVALDLAKHAGWGCSTHGNRAIHRAAEIDKKLWDL